MILKEVETILRKARHMEKEVALDFLISDLKSLVRRERKKRSDGTPS